MFYYELQAARTARGLDGRVAIVRIEQLYPLAIEQLQQILDHYPNAREIVWAQEEPQNMGAWQYMFPHLIALAPHRRICYAGRPASCKSSDWIIPRAQSGARSSSRKCLRQARTSFRLLS